MVQNNDDSYTIVFKKMHICVLGGLGLTRGLLFIIYNVIGRFASK